jgi:hypothetical protein
MLLLCRGALPGSRGHNLLLALGANHKENEFPGLGNDLTAFLCSDQRDGCRRGHLRYPVQIISQSNNHRARSRPICSMSPPQVWFSSQYNRKFKRIKVTRYLIREGLDAIGKATLLADAKISSFVKPPDGVRLWMCCSI